MPEWVTQDNLEFVRDVARSTVRPPLDFEDVAADVLERLVRYYDGAAPFRPYARRVVQNVVKDHLRDADDNMPLERIDRAVPENDFVGLEDRVHRHVVDIVRRIEPEKVRQAVELHFVRGMTRPQVSDVLSVSLYDVQNWLRVAKQQLSVDDLQDLNVWVNFLRDNNYRRVDGSPRLMQLLIDEGWLS